MDIDGVKNNNNNNKKIKGKYTITKNKMGKCPFQKNNPAFCHISQIN